VEGKDSLKAHVPPLAAASLVVAAWMALGWILHTDANQYLLLGVPITAGFQRLVARRPLRALWVRAAPRVRVDLVSISTALLLALAPAAALAGGARGGATILAWLLCALGGAMAAAYALREFRRETAAALLRCLGTAGAIGIAVMVLAWLARPSGHPGLWTLAGTIGKWLLLYFPVSFVLEEVFFRGALDSHVHDPADRRGWRSAAFVSVLWALWHLPITTRPGAVGVIMLLVVHVGVGIPLSLHWRRSGNLAVPAASHAAIDAVRNALLG
jgi:hypothetical protein